MYTYICVSIDIYIYICIFLYEIVNRMRRVGLVCFYCIPVLIIPCIIVMEHTEDLKKFG